MERYTPGDSPPVTTFMARRTLLSHAAFFRELLWPGARVLDCGCGPGTITAGIADCVGPAGSVTGIDANPSQLELARQTLSATLARVDLRAGSVYAIPFEDGSFDAVFAHALFEHLADPLRAGRELFRVLRPGGIAALRSPDWDGKLAGPPHTGLDSALNYYAAIQSRNGGNLSIGKHLGAILSEAGFCGVRTRASYECYEPVAMIAEYLALQIEGVNPDAAATLREWSGKAGAFFAQAWCEVVGRKPGGR